MKFTNAKLRRFVFSLAIALPLQSALNGYAEPRDKPSPTATTNNPYAQALAKAGKTGDWNEPDKTLENATFENLPITEVVSYLKEQFENAFDVLLPFGSADPHWSETPVSLRLKNVKASEIFNAMNLMFEAAGTPLHWELMMNGHRPTALLRLLSPPEPGPAAPIIIDPATGLPISPKEHPVVFFVGDLIGDPKSGGITMDELVETVSDVCKFALAGDHISSHKSTQLLIVRGTDADITFVQSTLAALREKARFDRQRTAQNEPLEPKSKPNEKGQ